MVRCEIGEMDQRLFSRKHVSSTVGDSPFSHPLKVFLLGLQLSVSSDYFIIIESISEGNQYPRKQKKGLVT